jgi:integrase
MAVRRDSNGRWRYRKVVKLPDGSTERISGTPTLNTRRDAERAERDHIERMFKPAAPPAREVISFRDFAEQQWLPTYPRAAGNRATTTREKQMHVRVHLVPRLGDVPLHEVRGRVVDRFFAELTGAGLSPKTRKNIGATLNKMLGTATEWGLIEAPPRLPRIRVPERQFDFLTPEESERLLAGARTPEARLLILFALRTGARASEQLALRWGDLDWVSHKVGFARSAIRGEEGPTKSGRVRYVPLTPELEAALRASRHLKSQLVFCRQDGKPLTLWQLHTALETACRRSGLREVRWHDLRHSFASQLAMRGLPLRRVQEWLGHSSIQMTMRYAHLAPGGDAHLIAMLDTRTGLGIDHNEAAER